MTKSEIKANKRLRRAFNALNDLYFDSRLAEPKTIMYTKVKSDRDADHKFDKDGASIIRLATYLRNSERMTVIALLHEMTHMDNGPKYIPHHGLRFYAGIHDLFLRGAYDELL